MVNRLFCLAVFFIVFFLASNSPALAGTTVNTGARTSTLSAAGTGNEGINAAEGTISISADARDGMYGVGGAKIVNNGLISVTGEGGAGVHAGGSGMRLRGNVEGINAGTIVTSGESAIGIKALIGSKATNTGTVKTTGRMAHGALASINVSAVTNSGTISTEGDNAHAVYLLNGSKLYNSGTLSATGTDAHAIKANSSEVYLLTGTKITNGAVEGMTTSSLYYESDSDAAFKTFGFGFLGHDGLGRLTILGNSNTEIVNVNSGQLAIDAASTYSVIKYWQHGDGTLVINTDDGSSGLLRVSSSADFGNGVVLVAPTQASHGQTFTLATVDGANYSNLSAVKSANPHFKISDYQWNGNNLEATVQYLPQWDNSAMTTTVAIDTMFNVHEAVRTRIELMTGLLAENPQEMASNFGPAGSVLVASAGDMYGLLPPSTDHTGWKPYIQLFGSLTDRDGTQTAAGYDANQFGATLGTDKQFDQVFGGVHFSYARAAIDFKTDQGSNSDRETQDLFSLGTYWHWQLGQWMIRDNLTASHIRHNSKRDDGAGGTAKGAYSSWGFGNSIFAGYGFRTGNWLFQPEVGLHYYHLYRESFTETDSGAPLSYDHISRHSLESEIDFTAKYRHEMENGVLTPFARAGWIHALGNNDLTVNQQAQGVTTPVYQAEDDNFLKGELGAIYAIKDFEFNFTYTGLLSEHTRRHIGTLKISKSF